VVDLKGYIGYGSEGMNWISAAQTVQGVVDILLLVRWQMEEATDQEVLITGAWYQGELQ
jgi:hypothetical protein